MIKSVRTLGGIIVISCLAITVQQLVFEIYSIPRGSMEEIQQPEYQVLRTN